MSKQEQGPTWNLDALYLSLSDPRLLTDLKSIEDSIQTLEIITKSYLESKVLANPKDQLDTLHQVFLIFKKTQILVHSIDHYLNALLAVDVENPAAQKTLSELSLKSERMDVSLIPFKKFIVKAPALILDQICQHPELKEFAYFFSNLKVEAKHFDLGDEQDSLLAVLRADGHDSWGRLYRTLAGSLKCKMMTGGQEKLFGISETYSFLLSAESEKREAAWKAIQETWQSQKEIAAAIANSLSGWRLAISRRRSQYHQEKVDFLDEPLVSSRINRPSLNAMIQACSDMNPVVRDSCRFMATLLNKPNLKLDPWDLLAPCPNQNQGDSPKSYSFDTGIKMIKEALSSVDSELSDFVQMAVDRNWIDGRILPRKTLGAFCTDFYKIGEPRVFMSYGGARSDVRTLAHELGHAYHSWLLRDLPYLEQQHPVTLSETASVFFETILREYFLKKSQTEEERRSCLWEIHSSAVAYLINIPARFEYEYNLYLAREKGILSPSELCDLTVKSWNKWYGDTLTQMDPYYWASKLHFSMSHVSFYNFPYTFGYLFSMNLYAMYLKTGAEKTGTPFFKIYKNILMDTGKMPAADLISKHTGENIENPHFWSQCIQKGRGLVL